MNTLQLINYIASNPQFTNVVIKDNDDKTPMQAIECLSCEYENNFDFNKDWRINSTLEKNTLLVYDKN
jgi:hypothetical protein